MCACVYFFNIQKNAPGSASPSLLLFLTLVCFRSVARAQEVAPLAMLVAEGEAGDVAARAAVDLVPPAAPTHAHAARSREKQVSSPRLSLFLRLIFFASRKQQPERLFLKEK